jgi:hypothetical protein
MLERQNPYRPVDRPRVTVTKSMTKNFRGNAQNSGFRGHSTEAVDEVIS